MRLRCTLCVLCALLLLSLSAFGQAVTGTLLGSVTDPTGGTIPGAKVVATEVNTGISREVTTNRAGSYSFTSMPPGTYDVAVEQTGFRKAVRERVDVLVNSTVRVDMTLNLGNVSESVVVTAETPILQTDRTDTGRKIETKQIIDLPLTTNRNFQGLLNLVPGTTRAFRPHSQFFNSQDSLSTQVNGQSRLANNVQFEGVDNNQRTGLLTVIIPPIEALQTVDITTSNYEAELGRAGGAVTNITLRSGTNDLHGSAYYYNRNSRLGARSTFATTKPRANYNYYGGTLGGPIVKNKTFFFGDYLGVKDRNGFSQLLSTPSLAYRQGNFSGAATIYDPATTQISADGRTVTRTPFANNIIPDNRISPIAKRLLAQLPAPTRAGQLSNYEAGTVLAKNTFSWDAKVDHQASDKDRISVRYSYQEPEVIQPPVYGIIGGPSGTANDGFAGTGTSKNRSAAVNYTRVWTPTLISELRLGVSRYRNDARNTDYGTNAGNDAGIKGANLSDFTSGLTTMQIANYSNPVFGYSASLPWVRSETNWNLVNNWTKMVANHTVKFGFDGRLNRDLLLQTQTFSPRGRFEFNQQQTLQSGANGSEANSFAAFLLDAPGQAGRDLPVIYPDYVQNLYFSFLQDKWQINQKLTLDLGLRHEIYLAPRPRYPAGFSNYNPENNTLELAGVGSIPLNLGRKNYFTNFAPRLGLSYRASEKTVVRMGYGISYMPFPDNSYAYNFPVRQNNVFQPAGAASAFLVAPVTMATGFPAPQPAVISPNGILPAATNQNYDVIPKEYHEGYVMSYNVAVQRALPKNFVLDVAYVGNRGIRNATVYNMNAGFVAGAGNTGRPLNASFGRTADTNIRFVGTNTYYNSLQVKFDRRYSNGFQMTTAYTFAKSIDYTGNNGGLRWYIDQARNRARSDYDRTHIFVQSYIYELPFGKGKQYLNSGIGSWLLGGWQVNGILTAMSGLPLNFSDGSSNLNTPGSTQTPNFVGEFKELGGIGATQLWFDRAAFVRETRPGVFGTIGRNILAGPAFFNLDASVFRRFPITERVNAEFRFESFNLTNTPQYGNPNTDISSSNFGRVTGFLGDSVGNPRTAQLGLRVQF